ncbi:hypothetical protein ACLMJK_007123 [Lecanora helva]
MSAYWHSVERPQAHVKPVKKPRGSQALTFIYTLLQPVTFAFLSAIPEQPLHAATKKHPYRPHNTPALLPTAPESPKQLENVFVEALAQACLCRQHAPPPSFLTLSFKNSTHLYHKPRRRYHHNLRQLRQLHRNAAPTRSPPSQAPLSREEYLSMIDWYREPFSTQASQVDEEPFRPSFDRPAALCDEFIPETPVIESQPPVPLPEFLPKGHPATLSASKSLRLEKLSAKPPDAEEPPSNHSDLPAVTKLCEILNNPNCDHESAFSAYTALPYPGVSHLDPSTIRLLFRRLSTLPRKTHDTMLHYLSVIDDMKSLSLPLTLAEWDSAIAFCGQCFTHLKSSDVESALRTWKEMEEEAGVRSGNVTFNILFDMAAKAGKFVLAEMILKEMDARKLSINRYARVGRIYYHGLRADGDAVRAAYRELVDAGEIVDTVVMNCNTLNNNNNPLLPLPPPSNWHTLRTLGRTLDRAARTFRHSPTLLSRLRAEQSLAPNLHTYAIFVEHHATSTGELRRVVALLTEMADQGVPMHGRIFVKLFKGFAVQGGVAYTSWTRGRLEGVWGALVRVLDEGGGGGGVGDGDGDGGGGVGDGAGDVAEEVKVMKWMVVWAVRAFERCAGKERMLEVWAELRRRWKPGSWGEMEVVMEMLRDVLRVDDH